MRSELCEIDQEHLRQGLLEAFDSGAESNPVRAGNVEALWNCQGALGMSRSAKTIIVNEDYLDDHN